MKKAIIIDGRSFPPLKETIREFLETKKEIDTFNEILDKMNCGEQIKKEIFIQFLRNNKNKGFNSCSHEIWLYKGSYCLDINNMSKQYYLTNNENDKNFHHNEYICLECGEKVKVENWENFEDKLFVLKNYNDINVENYIKLFYLSLSDNKNSIAKKIVIEEFNKNKTKSIVKTRKKNWRN